MVWVLNIILFNCAYAFLIDAVVFVTMSMEVIESWLTFCDITFWSLVIFLYTGCIKMIGAVLKLIIFTSMVNRIISTSRNESL